MQLNQLWQSKKLYDHLQNKKTSYAHAMALQKTKKIDS
jgi:hypothetical protein